ncbi:MAG: site-specific integrase [Thermoguttaceae bacterium]
MPSKPGFVPAYCLHKPSGRAYVRIHGKVVYCGDYGTAKSKAEYGRLVAEFSASSGCTVSEVPVSGLTVVELVAAYLDYARCYYQKNGKPTRSLENVKLAMRPIKTLYGREPVATFSPLALLVIQKTLADEGCTRSYVNKRVGMIKRMFKWGVSRTLVPPVVYTALATVEGLRMGRTTAKESKPVLPVSDELVNATVPFMPPVVANMVHFQRLTGSRPGEVCQLRPCDIDRRRDVWEYRPADHKTAYRGRERVIYIGPKAQAILRPYLGREPTINCFSPAESETQRHIEQRAKRRTRVQPSQRNRRKAKRQRPPQTAYTKDSYQRAIARAVVKANADRTKEAEEMGVKPVLLPHWHANQLRHSRATEVRQQFGLEAAQVTLGHAKADVTQVYAERDARLAVEVAKKIG